MKVEIYMKSGNVIVQRHLKEFNIGRDQYKDEIVQLEIEYKWYARGGLFGGLFKHLMVKSLCLGNIEGIIIS